jgi:Zn-dependent peptidase ImmA (M78 family)
LNKQQHRAGLRALAAAQRLFAEVGWGQREPVDVFALIADLDITLVFRPFKRLGGAYFPPTTDVPPTITINEQHPLALQRYSAGHELGHHIAHSEAVYDTETDLLARGLAVRNEGEYFAEAFAGWLLMPRRLVETKMASLEITDPLTAEATYRLSLDLGTSYEATLTQLLILKRLSYAQYNALRKIPPKETKEHVAGRPRAEARPDVWLLRNPRDSWIRPKLDDEVILELPETPTTSFQWEVSEWPATAHEIASEYRRPSDDLAYGGEGARQLRFRVVRPGRWDLHLHLRSPYDAHVADERRVTLDVPIPQRGVYDAELALAS